MLNQIFDFSTHQINWEEVEKIQSFAILKNTQQSTIWHKEGNVWTHTKLVVEAMQKELAETEIDDETKSILLLSALFHDIGKGMTSYLNEETKQWTSLNHDEVGFEIVRKLLMHDDYKYRECIAYFVRYHMKPLYIPNSFKGIRDIIMLSCASIFPDICNIKNLILLKKCDCLGAIIEDGKDNMWKDKLEFVCELAEEFDCFDKPYKVFENERSKYGQPDTEILPEVCQYINLPEDIEQIKEYGNQHHNIAFSIDMFNENGIKHLLNYVYYLGGNIIIVYGDKYSKGSISPIYSMDYIISL